MASTWSDPQFYIVTAIALGGLWLVVRPFLPSSKEEKSGCPTCTTCSVSRGADSGGPEKTDGGLVTLGSGGS